MNQENSEVELLVSYNRQPFNVAQIPFEDSHQVCYIRIYVPCVICVGNFVLCMVEVSGIMGNCLDYEMPTFQGIHS